MGSLAAFLGQQRDDERAENERLRKEIASLREQLRLAQEQVTLTNDKMVERERQARWEVAHDAMSECDTLSDFLARMEHVMDENAPKD